MKKFLLVLLASAAISPAMAQTYQPYNYGAPVQRTRQPVMQQQVRRAKAPEKYKIGNPLYHLSAQSGIVGGEMRYAIVPKTTSHAKSDAWDITPDISFGITDKLSVHGFARYGRSEVKSGPTKGNKLSSYEAQAGLKYLIASVDDFDFNINADIFYTRSRRELGALHQNDHRSGTNVGLQVGKKIENITPYFLVGFTSDFWSKKGSAAGTNTVINPGVYIDLTEQVSLNLSYESVVHQIATYKGVVDFYPQNNIAIGVGAYIAHPETDLDMYGALANIKVKF